MKNPISDCLGYIRDMLVGESGLNFELRRLQTAASTGLEPLLPAQIAIRDQTTRLDDENNPTRYPQIQVKCARVSTPPRLKVGAISAQIEALLVLRLSGTDPNALDTGSLDYLQAIIHVVERHAGPWTKQLMFDGHFTAELDSVNTGGLGFVKESRIALSIYARLGQTT